mmetsp:Transcript_12885/g.37973  ORF Transcript_12885/g.37973 Transcript_12885/m.37973 type:complete len:596 (-) Transcript_12885:429-2216(-)
MLMREVSMKTSMRKKRSPIRCSTPESRALFLPVCQKANPASTASTSVDTRLTQISIGCRSARRQWRAESESSCIANETGAHSRRAARTRRPRQPPASAAGSAISSGGVALPASARSSASILSTIAPLGSASASSSASAGLGEIWASRGEAPSASNHCARAHEPAAVLTGPPYRSRPPAAIATRPVIASRKRYVGWCTERRMVGQAQTRPPAAPPSPPAAGSARAAGGGAAASLAGRATPTKSQRAATTSRALVESRPESGSSISSTPRGLPWIAMSSTATETRRRSPPERPRMCASPMREEALRVRDRAVSVEATTAARCSCGSHGSRTRAWKCRCSATVEVPGNTSSCVTYPTCSRRSAELARTPPSATVPRSRPRDLRPARIPSSEDLPAPDGPMRQKRPGQSRCEFGSRIRFRPTSYATPLQLSAEPEAAGPARAAVRAGGHSRAAAAACTSARSGTPDGVRRCDAGGANPSAADVSTPSAGVDGRSALRRPSAASAAAGAARSAVPPPWSCCGEERSGAATRGLRAPKLSERRDAGGRACRRQEPVPRAMHHRATKGRSRPTARRSHVVAYEAHIQQCAYVVRSGEPHTSL